MKKTGFLILATFFLAWLSSVSLAQSIRSKIDTNSILIGTPIHLIIEIDLPANTKLSFPLWSDSLFNGLTLLETGKLDTIKQEGKSDLKFIQTLTITAFDSGDFTLPPLAFFVNGDSTRPLFTQAFSVKSTFPKVELDKEIKDIKPPLQAPFDWLFWILVVTVSILVLGVSWLAYQIVKKKKNPFATIFEEKPLPPHEKAIKKLEELKQKKLWQNGMEKQYHVELTEIVREYIEGRYKVQALEQVTDETLEEMKSLVNPEILSLLKQLLRLSDLIKFARQQAGQGENELSLNNAFEFIRLTQLIEKDTKTKEVGNG